MSDRQGIFALTGSYDRTKLISDSDTQEPIAGGGFVFGDRTYDPNAHPWLRTSDTTFSFEFANDVRNEPKYTIARIGTTYTQWIGDYAGLLASEKIEMERQDGLDKWFWRITTTFGLAGKVPVYQTGKGGGIDITPHTGVNIMGLNGNGQVDWWPGFEAGLSVVYHN